MAEESVLYQLLDDKKSNVVKVLNAVTETLNAGVDVVEQLKEFCRVLPPLNSVIEKCNSLKFEVDCEEKLKGLSITYERVVETALLCAGHVANVIWFANNKEKIKRIKKEIEGGEFSSLMLFLKQLSTLYLREAKGSYRMAEEQLNSLTSKAQLLATTCKKKQEEAKTIKNLSAISVGVTGAAISTVICAGGVDTHRFAFLGLTVVATGLGIYCLPSHFASSEKEFGELSTSFDGVVSSASRMVRYTRSVGMYLESVSGMVLIVFRTVETSEPADIISAFNRLCQKCGGLNTTIHKERLMATDEEFRTGIHEIFNERNNT